MPTTPKLFVAMPLDHDMLHAQTATSMWAFFRDPNFVVQPSKGWFNEDVYRVRSAYAHAFLKTDCTHLFFLDSDNSCEPPTVWALVNANVPIVAAPYVKKHARWLPGHQPVWKRKLEATDNPLRPALVPMGCTLIRRDVIERMTEFYGGTTWRNPARDVLVRMISTAGDEERAALVAAVEKLDDSDNITFFNDAQNENIVALFDRIMSVDTIFPDDPRRNLWAEDFSFCMRANAIGIDSYVHMGTGALHHDGTTTYPLHFDSPFLKKFSELPMGDQTRIVEYIMGPDWNKEPRE